MRRVRVTRERRGERWERRSERKSDEPPLSHLSLLASRAVGRSLSVPSLTSQARFVPVHFVHSLTARMEWVTGGIKGYIDNSLDTTPSRYARFRSGGDEWKGTACDSSLKSLPVSVVHPQILGIACQLLPFVSSFVGLVTRPSCPYPPHSLRTEPKVNGSNWSEMWGWDKRGTPEETWKRRTLESYRWPRLILGF